MISIGVIYDYDQARAFMIRCSAAIANRTELNEQLALRLMEELKEHFRSRNEEPNKMGAPKTGFWNEMAEKTSVLSFDARGASVGVGDVRFNLQLFGGTVFPTGGRKCLTIPIAAEARGKRVLDYERDSGHRLFRIPGRNVLFEKTDVGATDALFAGTKGRVRGRNRSFTVGLAARTHLRAVYALAKSATIRRDPEALPSNDVLLAALQSEANNYVRDNLISQS